ncbi:hypothetical protein O181_059565 [Austropuccinia psidii MF-1]|uniref:Uncharacterized protein n=1 Tax=Austropuccinia psidii MF-1 TaxID=1389203 RepID=A0A9Q3HYU8_9BASI|nr:hypothetical protein [Austropuccinia psidii MF-1]
MPEEYYCNTHSQCQIFTPTFPASSSTPPSYPSLFSLNSTQKLIQLPSGSDLPIMKPHSMIQTPSSLIKKPDQLLFEIKKSPMNNLPRTFGPPQPLDPLLMQGT